jgi:cold shock CspA family protein/ribosome-associated translation inhibitor RaiA
MQVPLQITFKEVDHSDAVEAKIRERVDRLDQYYSRIISCRVVISKTNRHHHTGNLFTIHVDLRVPGDEISISRDSGLDHAHKDIYVSIRDAFDAAKRALEDYVRRKRRDVKTIEKPPHGHVLQLVRDDGGFGFIQTDDGRKIYFNSRSVLHGQYDHLQVGMEVRFAEEAGEKGPQASTVELVSSRRLGALQNSPS